MTVKELQDKLDNIFEILGNEEIFGDALKDGEFEKHNHKNDIHLNFECYLCFLNIPKVNKVTINHLLNSYTEIIDFEKSFSDMLHDYLMGN